MAITHSTVATATDEVGAEVNKAEWNDDHVIDDGTLSIAKTTGLQTALNLKSPIASPTFTGTVVLPNVPAIVTTQLNLKAPLSSPTFTGTVVLPNVPAIVTTQLNLKAPLSSPTLVTPNIGTPSAGTLTNCTGLPLAGLTTAAKTESIIIAAGDETTAIDVATGKVEFQMPYAFTLTSVRATVTTAPTTSGTLTVDINEGGTTILSTKLTIDTTEKTSTTAATAPVISDTALADSAVITIDVDAISGGASEAGLKVYLIGYQV